jgi:hypothetical protein
MNRGGIFLPVLITPKGEAAKEWGLLRFFQKLGKKQLQKRQKT